MNLTFKFAAPDERKFYAYYYPAHKERGIYIILDNLTPDTDYTPKSVSDLYLQELLCAKCNSVDFNCKEDFCPYENIIDQIENDIWN